MFFAKSRGSRNKILLRNRLSDHHNTVPNLLHQKWLEKEKRGYKKSIKSNEKFKIKRSSNSLLPNLKPTSHRVLYSCVLFQVIFLLPCCPWQQCCRWTLKIKLQAAFANWRELNLIFKWYSCYLAFCASTCSSTVLYFKYNSSKRFNPSSTVISPSFFK